jgi:pilus assembly protein CpaC
MRIVPYTIVAGLAAALCCPAQTSAVVETARRLSVMQGRGELLQFGQDIQKVAIAEPKIADAVVLSPREVMVNGKEAGNTTLIVWETGAAPARWEIRVGADTTEFDEFRRQIRESCGDGVEVSGSGETLVLTGKVQSALDSKRAASLASTRAKNVVNLLQAPAEADPRQILLQVKFASIDRAALQEIGFNLFSRNDKMLGALTTQQFQAPRFSQLQFENQNFSNTTVNFADLLNIFVFRPDLNIGATIKALEARNLLQMLAEPNLITVEGKEGNFLAGGSFPFPTMTTTSTGGAVSPVITVQFKPFGVQLAFTPTVLPSGAINLKVAPEVSALDYANAVTLQGFLIPAISQRRAETEVVLRDGESFAIAGLLDNRVIQTVAKLPWLGDVPILGQLFRSRSTKKTTDELLVVVTPHFVRPLRPDEKAKLPDMPETFLPTVSEEQARKSHKKDSAKPGHGQAEFVGPRGYQEPK